MSKPAATVQALLEEDLAELYEDSPAGYVSTLPDGTIVKANRTFGALTGFAAAELAGRRFQDLLATPGRIYYETHLAPLLVLQGTLNEIALDIRCADGRALATLVSAAQKRSKDGEPLLNRFTVFNATDRRRYEQQLLDARRHAQAQAEAKTDLLAMLSHDIRTPLTAIMAVGEILQRTALDEAQAKAVRILRSSAGSLLELVNGILERSQLEAGAVAPHAAPFDLRALVHGLATNLGPLARSKGIALLTAIDERVPAQVSGDGVKLGQVLGNLVGNALKFTERGEVSVELSVLDVSPAQISLRVRVRDTGIGIPEEALERIFDEYGQAHGAIAPRFGGSGLGLAISRKLLRAQGSELNVQSRVGAGSEFWFDLTLAL